MLLKEKIHKYKRILWIGAHPDDELSISAIVDYTRLPDVVFGMISVTEGDSCKYNIEPKHIDFNCSSAYFGANFNQIFYYKNLSADELKNKTESDIINNWNGLEYTLASLLTAYNPDLIITIDPYVAFGGHLEHKVLFHFIKKAMKSIELNCEIWGSTSKLFWDNTELSIIAESDYYDQKPNHAKNIYRMHSCFSVDVLNKLTDIQETGMKILCYT